MTVKNSRHRGSEMTTSMVGPQKDVKRAEAIVEAALKEDREKIIYTAKLIPDQNGNVHVGNNRYNYKDDANQHKVKRLASLYKDDRVTYLTNEASAHSGNGVRIGVTWSLISVTFKTPKSP